MTTYQKLLRTAFVFAMIHLVVTIGYAYSFEYSGDIRPGFRLLGYIVATIITLIVFLSFAIRIHSLEVGLLLSFLRSLLVVIPSFFATGLFFNFVDTRYLKFDLFQDGAQKIILLNFVSALIISMFYTKNTSKEKHQKRYDDDTLDSDLN